MFESTRQTALKQFEHLEQKLIHDETLCATYRQIMKEYETFGHFTVTEKVGKYIIPRTVCKLTANNEMKLLVIFDGSARCRNGLALNDTLDTCPKLQRDLIDNLFKFRLFRYTFSVDICKIYKQILINRE